MEMKSQASITDAIILLLIAAFSSTLVFAFVGEWGNDQDNVLRSSYVLNYMQSVMKTMYYVDASTLNQVGVDRLVEYERQLSVDPANPTSPNGIFIENSTYNLKDDPLTGEKEGCLQLEDYPGTLRVTDLLKRDLGDSNPNTDPAALPKLDDNFGSAKIPGRTAMRCAMKELMKPFAFSGYRYYVEISFPKSGETVPVYGPEITNSHDLQIAGVEKPNSFSEKRIFSNNEKPGCTQVPKAGYDVIAVSAPFQVLYTEKISNVLNSVFVPFVINVCIWKSSAGREEYSLA